MKQIYAEEDLKRILCAGLDVKEITFDNKKKQLTIEIELPDPKSRLKELKELQKKIAENLNKPEKSKSPENIYQ